MKQALTPFHSRYGYGVARRIVLANIVNESSLPYGLAAVDTPEKAHAFWQAVVETQPDHEPEKENIVVILLNARRAPFAWHRVSLGDATSCTAHPRDILRPVIASNAFGFILMHNHPSGDPSPSPADSKVTQGVNQAALLMQVRFFDHLVIGRPSPGRPPCFSFAEAGLIP